MHSVLIIEDDPITLYVYKSHLEKAGFDVKIAKDGEAAFYVLQKTPPDAILLDLMLPRINGVEILKTIRAHKNFETIPVFVFTNLHLSNLAKEATKAGANRVFDKATTPPLDIVEAIREAVSQLTDTLAHDRISTSPPTEAKIPLQTVSESNLEIEPELLRAFVNKVPETFMALRKILQKLSKAEDTPERLVQLSELYETVHAVTSGGTATGLCGISQMGAALQALAKQLAEDPKVINVSTLRTVSHAIDFLDVLFKRGIRHDDAQLTPINILVVDDDRISRLAITSALARAKLKLLDVECPNAALRLLKDNPFDLIFLDVSMPKMNGFELCLELRKLPNHKTTPVVFITSVTDFESRSRSTLSGGNDLIAKPFLFTELAVKALTYALKGRLVKSNSDSDKTSSTPKPVVETQANPDAPDVQIGVPANPQPAIGGLARKTETQTTEPSDRPATMSRPSSAVITMDESGVIKSLNAAANALFGYESSEVVGLPVTVLIPDAQQTNKNQILIGQLIGDKAKAPKSGIHFVGVRKDKSRFPLSLSLSEIMIASHRMFTCIVRELGEPLVVKHVAIPVSAEDQFDHLTTVCKSSETESKTATPPPIDTAAMVRSDDPVPNSKSAAPTLRRVPARNAIPIPKQTAELGEARAELEKESTERIRFAARLQELEDIQVGLNQELRRRKQTEADLIKVQEDLENRVQERANELSVAQAALQTETAAREKLEATTQKLSLSQAAREYDLEQRKQLEHRLHQNQKQLETQLQIQGDALKKTEEEARKENEERQRVEALISESNLAQTVLNQELGDSRKSEDAWRARYEELERQFKEQNLLLAEAKSAFEKEIAIRQQLESDTRKLLSARAVVPQELIDRQKVEAELRQTQEDLEARVGEQSRKLAEVQAEYQQESTRRQRLETRTQELSDTHTALIEQHNQLQQLEKILREKEHAFSAIQDKLSEELNQQSENKALLQRERDELAGHYQRQSKTLSEAQAQLENELSHRQKLQGDASTLADELKRLEEELSDRDVVEANLRRAKEELEAQVGSEASKLAQLETQLLKASAERQRVEAHATDLFKSQIESAQELSRRKQTEEALRQAHAEMEVRLRTQAEELAHSREQLQSATAECQRLANEASLLVRAKHELLEREQLEETLRRTHTELEGRVGHQTAELERVQALLEKEVAHREKLEARAVELANAHASLTQEISNRALPEQELRNANAELQDLLKERGHESSRIEAELQQEKEANQQIVKQRAELARSHAELSQRLASRLQAEETLRRTQDELEIRVQHQARDLVRLQSELEKEICEHQKVTVRSVEITDRHAALVGELNERKQIELDLRLAKEQLASELESQKTRLAQVQSKLLAEVSERQRLETHACEFGKAHVELSQQLAQKNEAEAALRQVYVELGTIAEERLSRLNQTQAHLEDTLTERDQAVEQANELAQKTALVQEQLIERQKVEEALRKTQSELEGRIGTHTAQLARAEVERKNQVAEREQLDQRAAELAKVQMELKQELGQRTRTEEALRRADADLGKAAQERANELTATRAQLQKEVAQREQVEVEAARYAATQAAVEIELNTRRQAEQTLQQSQMELRSIIEDQAARLASIETELQKQTNERMRLEELATKFIAANSGLTIELSNYKEKEAQLRCAQEQLKSSNDALAKELASVQGQLEKEITEHLQIIDATAKLTDIQAELKKTLEDQRKSEESLRCSEAELALRVKTQAAEVGFLQTELQKEIAQREHAQAQAAGLLETQGALEKELDARQLAEQALQRSQRELESVIQSQGARLGGIATELQHETAERLRLDDQGSKLTVANSDLTKKLRYSQEAEATLRRTQDQLVHERAELTNAQTVLKGELEEQRKIEENFRRSETELALRVKTQAAEFGFLQTELEREIAQREHAQAQAAKLLDTKGTLEKELDARRLAEQGLQRSQTELESVIQSQATRLDSIEAELQHQTAERQRMECQGTKLTAANSDLTKKLSCSHETETTLRRTQEQLQNGIDALTKKLVRVEAKLDNEISEHVQLMDDTAKLANAHSELKVTLEEQRKIEENLHRSETEFAARVKTQAAEFSFLQAELQREVVRREQTEIREGELARKHTDLLNELTNRRATEQSLRGIENDLRVQIQAHGSEIDHLHIELRKENEERLRVIERATELAKVQIALKQKIFEHKQIENQLHRTHEDLKNQIEAEAVELTHTRAHLQKEIAELKQAKEKTAELVTEQAVFKREIADRKAIEEALRQRQSELEVRLHNSTSALASTQADVQTENAKRTSLEMELGQVRYSTLEFSRVKSEFLHNLSVQIRQPANRVLEVSGKLRKTPLTGEQSQALESLEASAEELLGADRRITEFSRFQVEPVRFEALPFDLYPVVEGAIESSRALAQRKDIELASLIYQEVPAFLRGDQNWLLQILRHLVTMSLKFTQTSPVLLRVTTEIDNQTDLVLRFSVNCDRPREFQEIQRWLQPASGDTGSPATLESGPVLDLAVARQLIEMCSGRFGMEPGVVQGAVLWCTLRLGKLSMVPGSVQVPVANLPALRVLVVESHPGRSEVFTSQLTSQGARNSTVSTAVDALSLLRNQALAGDPFSIAIVSGDLPDMSGLTLAKIAKAEPLLSATHFIIAAAATNLSDETQIAAAGVTACLIRPIRQSQLFAALEKTIGKTGERTSIIDKSQLPIATPATPPKTACSQNLQIVRAGPFGESPPRDHSPF